jgi:hypothetical protein
VLEVLFESKHPDARIPHASNFKAYEICPELMDINMTEEVCCKVAWRLQGSIGLGGSDTTAMGQWLLRCGEAGMELQKVSVEFTSWITNELPPWVMGDIPSPLIRMSCGSG